MLTATSSLMDLMCKLVDACDILVDYSGMTSYNKPSNTTTRVPETTLASHETTPAAETTTVNNPSTYMNQGTAEELTLSPETPDECKHTTNTMNPTTQPITMNPRSGTTSSSVEENGEKRKTPWWPKDVPLLKQITSKQLRLLLICSHKNSQCRLTFITSGC